MVLDLFVEICLEDIEDASEHYVALLGIEFEADTVKKISIHVSDQEGYIYVLPLIEHKTYVDYDVAMQLLSYMVVWYDYRKTVGNKYFISGNADKIEGYVYTE